MRVQYIDKLVGLVDSFGGGFQFVLETEDIPSPTLGVRLSFPKEFHEGRGGNNISKTL